MEGAWSPELYPRHRRWGGIARFATLKCLGIIGGPQVQGERIPQRRLERDTDPARALYRGASVFEADDRRGVSNAHVGEGRDLPSGIQMCRDRRCLAVGYERAGEILGPAIL